MRDCVQEEHFKKWKRQRLADVSARGYHRPSGLWLSQQDTPVFLNVCFIGGFSLTGIPVHIGCHIGVYIDYQ